MEKKQKNLSIYIIMMILFSGLIYIALKQGTQFDHLMSQHSVSNVSPITAFQRIIIGNLSSSAMILLMQMIVILLTCWFFSYFFKKIGQPGVIGEIVAGVILGPSFLGYLFPHFSAFLFPASSLINIHMISQIGLIFFMFVIGLEVDFNTLKSKINETLVISHAGILVPFLFGIVSSYWVYEKYAAQTISFLPFALFMGISMSITAFPVLARIIQERGLTYTPLGILSIASAANDDVTAWCLLAIVIAIVKAGTFVSALFAIFLTVVFILVMFLIVRPFFQKIGNIYANNEVINKTFVSFIFLTIIISAATTELIGIHAIFGAFLAGVIMPSNLTFRRIMIEKVEDVTLAFFLPLFFVYTGLNTDLFLINTPDMWFACVFFIFIAILGKFGGCAIAAKLVGENWHNSLTIGMLMNTRGLMELVALNIGYELGVLPKPIFAIMIIMALATTFMTTPALNLIQYLFAKKAPNDIHVPKLMLSFGRPESGKSLLSIYNLLFGDKLKEKHVIAAHYTMGTDLNLVSAEHYSKDSFHLLNKEATAINLEVDKRYKLTDDIVNEILQTIAKEHIDYLLIGAGHKLLDVKPAEEKKSTNGFLDSFIAHIKEKTFQLPGTLMTEKTEEIMERTECNVMVLINHRYSSISKVFIIINCKEDFAFLTYLDAILQKSPAASIYQLGGLSKDLDLRAKMDSILAKHPDKVGLHKYTQLSELSFERKKDHLIISSYATCKDLAQSYHPFNSLPSYLAIRQRIQNTL